jgi:hypothetical protein
MGFVIILVSVLIPLNLLANEICNETPQTYSTNQTALSWSVFIQNPNSCMDTIKFTEKDNSTIWVFNSNGNILNTKRIGNNAPSKLASYKIIPTLIRERKPKFETIPNSQSIKYSYFQGIAFHISSVGKLEQVEGCTLKDGRIKNCQGHIVIVGTTVTDEKGATCSASGINNNHLQTENELYLKLKSIPECAKLTLPHESKSPAIVYSASKRNILSTADIIAQDKREKADALKAKQPTSQTTKPQNRKSPTAGPPHQELNPDVNNKKDRRNEAQSGYRRLLNRQQPISGAVGTGSK